MNMLTGKVAVRLGTCFSSKYELIPIKGYPIRYSVMRLEITKPHMFCCQRITMHSIMGI